MCNTIIYSERMSLREECPGLSKERIKTHWLTKKLDLQRKQVNLKMIGVKRRFKTTKGMYCES